MKPTTTSHINTRELQPSVPAKMNVETNKTRLLLVTNLLYYSLSMKAKSTLQLELKDKIRNQTRYF